MNEENKRRLLSILCHGSIFFSCFMLSVILPVAILYTSKDRVVRANAKEALNFHLSIFIWFIISFILIMIGFALLGYLLMPLIIILNIIMPIVAMVAVLIKSSIPYRYPVIFRFIK